MNKCFVQKTPKIDVPKKEYIITLPYLGPMSHKVQKQLKKLFRLYIPSGKLIPVFKTQRRISHFFRFKDVVPPEFESHHIYQFNCPSCNAGYIGETRCNQVVRNSQHLGISEFTGKRRTGANLTSVTKHILEQDNCHGSMDNFRIIGKESNYHHRLIKESLFIKYHDPVINDKVTSTKIYLF